MRVALALGLLALTPAMEAVAAAPIVQPATPKSRLLVLTDIENEPDDTESLVRLLLYSNEIDLEGLIATTSIHQRARVAPESILRVIDGYAAVRANLVLHDAAYPTAAALRTLVGSGQPGYGMAAVDPGKDSDGSRRIIAALEKPDSRPLWITGWGGPNTLAQALLTLRATHSPDETKRLIAKLRVYTISDQDDSGPWMRREFPDLFYIVSPGGYGAATWTGMNKVVDGIDNATVSNDWIARNIQQGHGALGALYPDVGYGMEGDTPSFLGLIPNGLSAPDHPDWGGWGGRYTLHIPDRSTTDPNGFTGGVPVPAETRPIWTNTIDTVTPHVARPYGQAAGPGEQSYTGFRETIWRWRDDFQNDFAARIEWTTRKPGESNHPPIPRLAHLDRLTVHSGDRVLLSALGSTDPDGDSLSYWWFYYPESGTVSAPIKLDGADNLYARSFVAPDVPAAQEAHFILRVTDKGTPPLSRYRRVIVTILPR